MNNSEKLIKPEVIRECFLKWIECEPRPEGGTGGNVRKKKRHMIHTLEMAFVGLTDLSRLRAFPANQASEGDGSEEQGGFQRLTHLIWVWNMDFTASWLKNKTDTQMEIIIIGSSHTASNSAQHSRLRHQSFGQHNQLSPNPF